MAYSPLLSVNNLPHKEFDDLEVDLLQLIKQQSLAMKKQQSFRYEQALKK